MYKYGFWVIMTNNLRKKSVVNQRDNSFEYNDKNYNLMFYYRTICLNTYVNRFNGI